MRNTLIAFIISLVIILCFPVITNAVYSPETAHFNCWNLSELLNEDYNENSRGRESLVIYDYYRNKITNDYIRRSLRDDMTVDEDGVVADFVDITINKNKTLTIDKGVTLEIRGKITVDGKLINNGTIIMNVGQNDAPNLNARDKDDKRESNIDVMGTFTNTGTVTMTDGSIVLSHTATLINDGQISISHSGGTKKGLRAHAAKDEDKILYPTLTNNGTIYVDNKKDYGIALYYGAFISNNGGIYKSDSGSIKGPVNGNQVERYTPSK